MDQENMHYTVLAELLGLLAGVARYMGAPVNSETGVRALPGMSSLIYQITAVGNSVASATSRTESLYLSSATSGRGASIAV